VKLESHIDTLSDMRDEQDAFALACFRAISPDSKAVLPPGSVSDWNLAVGTLEIHGLLPFVGSAAAGGEVPDDIRQRVLKHRLRLSLYHANALDALTGISRELQAAGIPYAVLKGTYLYELLYRDRFPRAYGDIDLLVPADRLAEATVALRKAGYGDDPAHASRGGGMPRWHFHAELTSRKPGGLPVELHRSLVDRCNLYRIPEAELFGRLVIFKTRQGSFTVLSTEDEFLYLSLHVAKHGILNAVGLRGGYPAEWFCGPAAGNRLLWFLDIALFLQTHKDDLDWEKIDDRIQRWNVAEDVHDCLRVLRLLQPESLAQHALERLGAAGSAPASRTGACSRWLRSKTGQRWTEWSMRTNPVLCIRPIRPLLVGRSLAPSPARLLGYYGRTTRAWLPWLYLTHPVHMLRKLLLGDTHPTAILIMASNRAGSRLKPELQTPKCLGIWRS